MTSAGTSYRSRRYALQNRWDPRHLTTVKELLPFTPGDEVLELGCGRGHLAKRMKELGLLVTGVDANTKAPEVAVTDNLHSMRVEALAFPDASFDGIVSFHMIEHVPELEQALVEMHRVLRPGGHALLVYPAEPIRGAYSWPASIILHGTPFRAREIHVHKLNPSRLQAMTSQAGFEHVHSEFHFRFTPQYATVLRRPATP